MFENIKMHSAKTCTCCGQSLPQASNALASASASMLQLLSAAYDKARQKHSAEITVAHLMWCLAFGETADNIFEQARFDRDDMLSLAYYEMERTPRATAGAEPAPSQEVIALLKSAQQLASERREGQAEILHLIVACQQVMVSRQRSQTGRENTRVSSGYSAGGGAQAQSVRREERGYRQEERNELSVPRGEVERECQSSNRAMAALAERLARMERLISGLHFEKDWQSPRSGGEREPRERDGARNSSNQRQSRRSSFRQRLRRRRLSVSGGAYGERQRGYARQMTAANDGRDERPQRQPRAAMQAYMSTPRRPRDADRSNFEAEDEADGNGERTKRFYLALDDEIVRAPSIGTKTAARLNDFGIYLVRDLLNCDAATIARQAGSRAITAQRIADWQAQARLVCMVPWLRGTHAQLLVGAGYGDAEAIAAASPSDVCAAILKFASTRDGQSVLRAGPPPDIERVMKWVEYSALAEPERAAA